MITDVNTIGHTWNVHSCRVLWRRIRRLIWWKQLETGVIINTFVEGNTYRAWELLVSHCLNLLATKLRTSFIICGLHHPESIWGGAWRIHIDRCIRVVTTKYVNFNNLIHMSKHFNIPHSLTHSLMFIFAP